MRKVKEFEGSDQFNWLVKVSSPEDSMELAAALWSLILTRAKEDLKNPDVATKMDAYYWLTSRRSDLYTNLAPRFNVHILPSMFRKDVIKAGLPDFPDNGVPFVTMDTDDLGDWCGAHHDEDERSYVARLADVLTDTDIGDHLLAAAINGCEFRYHGARRDLLSRVVSTFMRSKAKGQYRKGIRHSILQHGAAA